MTTIRATYTNNFTYTNINTGVICIGFIIFS